MFQFEVQYTVLKKWSLHFYLIYIMKNAFTVAFLTDIFSVTLENKHLDSLNT